MDDPPYQVRELIASDAVALQDAYARNKQHLAPWEPIRPDSFYTLEGQAADIAHRLEEQDGGRGATWVIERGSEIVGRVALSNVARGVFQSCSIGYWVDGAHTGRGLATRAVNAACGAARLMGLHRVEAATILDNGPSQGVLERCGFHLIGVAPAYLFIAGSWRDHRLYQLLLHSDPPN